jgi:DNA-binding transcriptional LysR family regulator
LLSQLKCAHVLAKTLNFHRAAHLLGMSQPQLTRVIKALEKELGLVLFKRSSQGVTLTPDGVQALREAAVLLKAQDVFAQKMMALRNRSAEELKVAVGAFVSQSWASTAVTMLNNSHPAIAIRR